jgi:calcyclin binding protein
VGGWGWEQNADFVEVTIFDGLEGVGSLPRDQIAVSFEASGFDLKVHGLRGKNLRLRVNNLEKDINTAASKLRITKNRIIVQLKKAGSWEHWANLTGKKPRGAAAEAGKSGGDPAAGLMDVMRDLYEDGDDTTRKVIAEAWTKSRDMQMRGVPSFPEGDAL